jgi:four helix bundle protein
VPGFACHSGRRVAVPGDAGCGVSFFIVGLPSGVRRPTMKNETLPFQRLDSYRVARELAQRVHQSRIRDAELRDQATRAAKSAFLGLCEGLPSDSAGIRRRHFDIANNSRHEAIGAIDLASAIGALDQDAADEMLSLAVRLKRMLRALIR